MMVRPAESRESTKRSPAQLKSFLDQKVLEYNTPRFIESDPISIPHAYTSKEDREIAGLLSALLSWGNRAAIVKSARQLMSFMDNSPHEFLVDASPAEFGKFQGFVYRTFQGDDCLFLLQALRNLYIEKGGIEIVFNEGYEPAHSIKAGIMHFRNILLKTPHLTRSEKHLANPGNGSAAKRLNMFLRWMVRNDGCGVDLGIWKLLPQSSLMCPLDLHSGRVARKLGLLQRKQDDWTAVEELTASLRKFDPDDPIRYDFALFGMGINEKLKPE